FVVQGLNAPAAIIPAAQKLAVKHIDYGVKAEHYTLVGNALLRTLKKGLGDEFTPEVRQAWIAAYQVLADVMREAAYGSDFRLRRASWALGQVRRHRFHRQHRERFIERD